MEIIIKDLMVVMTTLGKGQTVLWTSNSTVTKGGKAVCGRGFAKQLTEKYPGLKKLESMYLSGRKTIEERVDKYGNKVFLKEPVMHQVYCNYHNRKEVWAFPVKTAYWEKADLNIIEQNAKRLRELALDHMPEEFHINFPGIGAGELNYEEVLPVLEKHWGDVPNIKVYKLQAQ